MVIRRMLDTLVISPNCSELTVVFSPEKYGVLKMFVPCNLNSSDRVSLMVMVLLIAMSKVNCAGPSIMFRPASP